MNKNLFNKTKKTKKIIRVNFLLFLLFSMVLAFNVNLVNAGSNSDYDFGAVSVKLLNQDPDPARAGEYVELRFQVQKTGNQVIENVKFTLNPKFPFSFDSSDSATKELGDLVGNSDDEKYYTLYYKLRVDSDALEGDYDVELIQTSGLDNSAKVKKEYTVRVGDRVAPDLSVGFVRTNPGKLIADFDEALVEVEVVNNGDDIAKQVIAELNLPDGFTESFGYSSRVNLGSIGPGMSKTAKFYVDTKEALKQGSYKTSIDLKYRDDTITSGDKIKKVNLPFEIKVFGRPEYEITDVVVKPVKPGQDGQISFKVKNIGSRDSEITSVQIFKDSSQPFTFDDKSEFIGKLNVGESSEVLYNYKVDSDANEKEYKLKLQIRSVVDNDVLVEDENINIEVGHKQTISGTQTTTRVILYIAFLLVGIFIGMKIAKKRHNKRRN